jgi:hypothetical protein
MVRHILASALFTVYASLVAFPLDAQDSVVEIGSRVRLTTAYLVGGLPDFPDVEERCTEKSIWNEQTRQWIATTRCTQRFVGTLIAARGDSLVIEQAGLSANLLTGQLSRFDVSRGHESLTLRGAGLGFLTGALVGLGVLAVVCAAEGGCNFSGYDYLPLAVFGGGGAVLGTITGAIIGSNVHRERWEEIEIEQLRTTMILSRQGIGLTATFPFP